MVPAPIRLVDNPFGGAFSNLISQKFSVKIIAAFSVSR